ncbi:hypothetical protein C8R45DRAFT_1100561 [Mycena sanguinolenta]|nr:hypothetical protein C8R45DRAFT_1100561 [Mycena sanguinolenta]
MPPMPFCGINPTFSTVHVSIIPLLTESYLCRLTAPSPRRPRKWFSHSSPLICLEGGPRRALLKRRVEEQSGWIRVPHVVRAPSAALLPNAPAPFSRDSPHPFCDRLIACMTWIASPRCDPTSRASYSILFFAVVQSRIHESVPMCRNPRRVFSYLHGVVPATGLSLGTRWHDSVLPPPPDTALAVLPGTTFTTSCVRSARDGCSTSPAPLLSPRRVSSLSPANTTLPNPHARGAYPQHGTHHHPRAAAAFFRPRRGYYLPAHHRVQCLALLHSKPAYRESDAQHHQSTQQVPRAFSVTSPTSTSSSPGPPRASSAPTPASALLYREHDGPPARTAQAAANPIAHAPRFTRPSSAPYLPLIDSDPCMAPRTPASIAGVCDDTARTDHTEAMRIPVSALRTDFSPHADEAAQRQRRSYSRDSGSHGSPRN